MDFRRRLAQANAQTSPVKPLPVTPRNRPRQSIAISHSPASMPSISSSIPFDWEAVRNRRQPPFPTPRREHGTNTPATPRRKAVIRQKSFYERLINLPSQVMFELSIFPNNVPFPEPKTAAAIIGGFCHFMHICVRVHQINAVPDSASEWYSESNELSWFDWSYPVSFLLIIIALGNAIFLFTRIKIYRLHHRPEPVGSPNAKFVSAELDFASLQPPTLFERFSAGAWHAFKAFWRFLFGWKASETKGASTRTSKVQQIEMWNPGDQPTRLFCIYSPAHFCLWMATNSDNWMVMLFIMVVIGFQLHTFVLSYSALIKDKEIVASEVMSEYNTGFVYPRINPIRKDVATMTHEGEIINVWED